MVLFWELYLECLGADTGLGLLHFLQAGTLERAKWGKTLAIIVSGLYIVLSIVEIVKLGVVDYISLIINTAIIIYLLFFYKDN